MKDHKEDSTLTANKIAAAAEEIVNRADQSGKNKQDVIQEIEAPDFSADLESLVLALGAGGDPKDASLIAIAEDAMRRAMDGGLKAAESSRSALIMAVNQVYANKEQAVQTEQTVELAKNAALQPDPGPHRQALARNQGTGMSL